MSGTTPLIQPSKETLFYRRSLSFLHELSKHRDSINLIYGFISLLLKDKVINAATVFEVHHKQGDYIGKVADAKSLVFKEIMEIPWQVKDESEPLNSAVDSFLAHRPVTHKLDGNKREIFCLPIVPEVGQTGYMLQLNVSSSLPIERYLYPHSLIIFQNMLKLCCNMERDLNTGLYNRQLFDRCLDNFINISATLTKQAIREGLKKSLVLLKIEIDQRESMEVDKLKKHEVQIAGVLRSNFRNSDLIFHYSDSEYAIILFNNTEDGTQAATERCVERLNTLKLFGDQQASLSSTFMPLIDESNAIKVLTRLRLLLKNADTNG